MHGAPVRRRAALLAAVLLCLQVLSGCAAKERVDLPQIRELRADLLEYSAKVLSVSVYHYSTSPYLSIDIDGYDLSRDDAFALVRIVRETAVKEDFQRDYYNERHHGDGWERIVSGRYYPDNICVFITADEGMYEFESRLFSDGTPATGGKGEDYDGYSTWRGSFSRSGYTDERYFSNEDIMGGSLEDK